MDSKILLQDLANGVCHRSGLAKREGDNFVRAFFAVIEQYLQEDKIVKIKGLGTFKVIEVSGRDSINVNTGERFHIQGHSKITFTPDSALRDHVNRPFADFETIILNDGVDLAEMEYVESQDEDESEDDGSSTFIADDNLPVEVDNVDTVDFASKESESVTAEVQEEEGETVEAQTEDGEEVAVGVQTEDGEEVAAEVQTEGSEQEIAEAQIEGVPSDKNEVLGENVEISEGEPVPAVEDVASEDELSVEENAILEGEEVAEGQTSEEESVVEEEPSEDEEKVAVKAIDNEKLSEPLEDSSQEDEPSELPDRNADRRTLKIVAKTVLFMLLLMVSYWLGSSHLFVCKCDKIYVGPQQKTSTEKTTDKPSKSAEKPKPATTSTPVENGGGNAGASAPQTGDVKDSLAEVSVSETKQKRGGGKRSSTPVETVVQSDSTKPVIGNPNDYPQVKSGDYEIVGVKCVHVLQSGETISKLSRKYLGGVEMNVYIIKLNDLKRPDLVKVGQEFKIPELRKK